MWGGHPLQQMMVEKLHSHAWKNEAGSVAFVLHKKSIQSVSY